MQPSQRIGSLGCDREVRGVYASVQELALTPYAAIVIDTEIPADPHEPRLKVCPTIERMQGLIDFQEDILA